MNKKRNKALKNLFVKFFVRSPKKAIMGRYSEQEQKDEWRIFKKLTQSLTLTEIQKQKDEIMKNFQIRTQTGIVLKKALKFDAIRGIFK